jgi:hypothetical protein
VTCRRRRRSLPTEIAQLVACDQGSASRRSRPAPAFAIVALHPHTIWGCIQFAGGHDMRLVALGAVAFVLAGCVTASNTLPLEQVAEFRLGEVSVSFADGAQVPPDLRSVAGPKLKSAMERDLTPRMKGSNAVRVDVHVRSITVASDAQRILVGGHHGMTADVTLVDLRTKSVLVTYAAQSVSAPAGQGIGGALLDRALMPDPVDRIAANFAFKYGEWLRPSEPRT